MIEKGLEEKDILKKIYDRIPRQVRICFLSAVICGIITHLYMITHKLPNWDDVNNLFGYASGADYGRFVLPYIRPLMGNVSVPALNGMLTILFVAAASCFVVQALHLRTATSAVLTGLMLVTFPAFASIMTFMFTSSCYGIGIMFACGGAYAYGKGKHGYVIAGILWILSLGVYQSYICMAAGILVLCLLLDLIRGEDTGKIFKNGIKAVGTLGVTMVLYLVLAKLFSGGYYSDDRGVSTMGQIQITQIPRLIMRSYKRIAEYFCLKPYSFISGQMKVVNIAVLLLIVLLFFLIIYKKKFFEDKKKLLLSVFLMGILPMTLASIYIMAPETQDASLLMLYQYVFVYVILIALLELSAGTFSGNTLFCKLKEGLLWIGVFAILITGYENYRLINDAYFRMDVAFDRSYAYFNRIIQSVESQKGYQYGDTFAILGSFYETPLPMNSLQIEDWKYKDFSGIALENGMVTEGIRADFMRTYMGVATKKLNEEEMNALKKEQAYLDMPEYPAEGSIKKIKDIWVVKVCEDDLTAVIY